MPESQVAARFPPELADLLDAAAAAAREKAWTAFLATHTRLLLHSARHVAHGYDAAMDAYTFLVEQLSRDDYHKLRAYQPDGRTKFTTWLVVVARRFCVDFLRHKYGRRRRWVTSRADWRAARRSLAVLVDDVGAAETSEVGDPAASLMEREQAAQVAAAVAHLDAPDQLLLKLRFEDDYSLHDIALIMGFRSHTQARRHLKHVLEGLRPAVNRLR